MKLCELPESMWATRTHQVHRMIMLNKCKQKKVSAALVPCTTHVCRKSHQFTSTLHYKFLDRAISSSSEPDWELWVSTGSVNSCQTCSTICRSTKAQYLCWGRTIFPCVWYPLPISEASMSLDLVLESAEWDTSVRRQGTRCCLVWAYKTWVSFPRLIVLEASCASRPGPFVGTWTRAAMIWSIFGRFWSPCLSARFRRFLSVRTGAQHLVIPVESSRS